jgi:hypothetical protein
MKEKIDEKFRAYGPSGTRERGRDVRRDRVCTCIFFSFNSSLCYVHIAAQPSFFLGRQGTFLSYAWTPTGLIATWLIALLFI